MKKTIIIYSLAAMASLSLAGCNGDYDDWASPQSYSQESAAAKYGVSFAAGPEANDNGEDADGMVALVLVSSPDSAVTGYSLNSITVNGKAMTGTVSGDTIKVNALELEQLVCKEHNSRASVARDLDVKTSVSLNLASGDAVTTDVTGETKGTFTPRATPAIDEKGYYMLGFINGNNSYDNTKPVPMTKVADGIYRALVTTTGTSNYVGFYGMSNFVSGDWNEINKGSLGSPIKDNAATSGFLVYANDAWGGINSPVISGAGTWLVELDVNDLTYSFTKPTLYMAGNANGNQQIDYLTGTDANTFTGYMYLDQQGFKFYNWDGSVIATNNTVSQDGYYKVSINLSTKQTTYTLISRIGIIGDATADGWNADQPMTYNKAERCWELSDVTMKAGTFKFRANNGWDINWGGTADALTQGGDNISIDAGTYDIKLYAWADGKAYCTITKK